VAGRRVLITGVGSYFGTELARRLEAHDDVEHVVGLDTRRPRARLKRTELIDADIRDPRIAGLIAPTRVDTVVHEQIVRQPGAAMSARTMHDVNVIGTLQLLAACEQADSIETFVVRGSAGIYGAEPNAPQFFTEDMARLFPLRTRFQRDVGEIENYFQTYARRHPGVTCTMLRYQPALGAGMDTQLSRYLEMPVVPTHLGFDPRLQVVHSDDAVDALAAAVRNPVHGAVNVAGPGTIGLTRAVRLAGRPTLPLLSPVFGSVTGAAKRAGFPGLSEDFSRLVRHGRAVDVTRLEEEVGFRPHYTTEMAVEDWVERTRRAKAAA
jgi:UDP-glucose 4-epimerase